MGFIILMIIGGAIIGVVLAFVLAPIIMVGNKKKLKEMDKKIAEFEGRHFSTPEEKEKAKQQLKKELLKIKAGITADKKATEEARDKINIL